MAFEMTDEESEIKTIDAADFEPSILELGDAAVGLPVCYIGYGSGVPPGTVISNEKTYTRTVTKCLYPWQIPIGIVTAVATDSIQVQTGGTFQPDPSKIFGHPDVGVRVYVDPKKPDEYSCVTSMPVGRPTYRGRFPGAATIGYISAIDGNTVTITIDPQPPRAKYVLTKYDDAIPAPGHPILINQSTGVAKNWTTGSGYCDGLYTGTMSTTTDDVMTICTSGPTWVSVTKSQLFARHSLDELTTLAKVPQKLPIGADLALMSGAEDIGSGTNRIPRIGYVYWEDWYDISQTGNFHILVDVDLSNPTPAGSEPYDPYEDHLILERLYQGFIHTSSDNWPFTVVQKTASVKFPSVQFITPDNRILNTAHRANLPCDTPIGIVKEFFVEGQNKFCWVAVKGSTFWINASSVKIRENYPQSSSINVVSRTIIGTRLYHNPTEGDYYFATDYVDYGGSDYGILSGWYPGAATIGYISAVHTFGSTLKYQITIDPQPATADYLIGPWEYPDIAIGTDYTNPHPIRICFKLQGRMGLTALPLTDNVVTAAALNVRPLLLSDTTSKKRVTIAVRRGYAWWPLSDEQLYGYNTRDEIKGWLQGFDYGYDYDLYQSRIPLDRQGEIVIYPHNGTSSGNSPIIVGYLVGLSELPNHTDTEYKYPYLVYIDPELPTPTYGNDVTQTELQFKEYPPIPQGGMY